MRQYQEPIRLHSGRNHLPLIQWRNRRIQVLGVLDRWRARGRWWGRDETRMYLRLHTDRGVVEIYRSGTSWYISRVLD